MSTPDFDDDDDFNWTSVCDEALRQEEESSNGTSTENLPTSDNVRHDRMIVEVQFKKPLVEVRTSRKSAVKRKFPGPAGVVGKIDGGSASGPKVAKIVQDEEDDDEESPEPISSQIESTFLSSAELMDENEAWQMMLKEETNVAELMGKFDTKFIFDKIATYGLQPMRSPFLVGIIKSIVSNPGLDPDIELMDKNGKISGLIHRDVVDSDGDKLKPGTVLVLRNVAVRVKQKKPSIIIAKNNIVSLYWNAGSKFGITSDRVVTVTRKDIMQAAAKMERENRAAASMATSSSTNSTFLNHQAGPGATPSQPPILTTVSTRFSRFPLPASVSSSMISRPSSSSSIGNPKPQPQQPRLVKPPLVNPGNPKPPIPNVIRNIMSSGHSVDFNNSNFRGQKLGASVNESVSKSNLELPSSSRSSQAAVEETLEGLDEDSLFGDF